MSSLHFLGIFSLSLILFSRSSQASIEKKEHERQEKLLKGPGTFPLERLLAIFCCISAEFVDDEDETDSSMMTSSEVKHGKHLPYSNKPLLIKNMEFKYSAKGHIRVLRTATSIEFCSRLLLFYCRVS